MIIINFPSAY